MDIRRIPRGICSRAGHEPLPDAEHNHAVERQLAVRLSGPAPERQTVLEDEIEEIIAARDPQAAARRILLIPRIARGLKLLDDVDSGAVELLCLGSGARPDSSDAR